MTKDKYIRFEPRPEAAKGRKTQVWRVITTYDPPTNLGWIGWFARWRKYAFYPDSSTVYEQACLRDIANFCEEETKKYKVKV